MLKPAKYYSGTSDKGPSEIGTTALQMTLVAAPCKYFSVLFTSEIGTSLQGTKLLAPSVPCLEIPLHYDKPSFTHSLSRLIISTSRVASLSFSSSVIGSLSPSPSPLSLLGPPVTGSMLYRYDVIITSSSEKHDLEQYLYLLFTTIVEEK